MIRDQVADELMIELLFVVLNLVHQAHNLVLLVGCRGLFLHGHGDVFSRDLGVYLLLDFLLLVEAINFQKVLADESSELGLQSLWQVLADVPHSGAAIVLRLLDATVIVVVFEKQDAPELLRDDIHELIHLIFLDLLNHKVDVVLGVLEVSLLCMQPHFVEVSVHDFAAKLPEHQEKLQE